jgi:ubiquinone/menaquinone biosynthesis C-methylase UbiE
MGLVVKAGVGKNDPIMDVGVGASTLVDVLLDSGHTNIIGVDISEVALRKLRERLGNKGASHVQLVADDVTHPERMLEAGPVALWHDRAMLHFLLEDEQVETYFNTLRRMVKVGGHVIISTFSLDGVERCTGLLVRRYSAEMIGERLGADFRMIESFDHLYHNPLGAPRPYIYTLFERTGP